LLVSPDVSLNPRSSVFLQLLILLGVWMGSRLAWWLSLLTMTAALLLTLVAATSEFVYFAGFPALWVGLLVMAPTREWVSRRGRLPASAATS
jgi:hypothetical protein